MTRPLSARTVRLCNWLGWALMLGGALGCWAGGLPAWAGFAAGMLAMDVFHVLVP